MEIAVEEDFHINHPDVLAEIFDLASHCRRRPPRDQCGYGADSKLFGATQTLLGLDWDLSRVRPHVDDRTRLLRCYLPDKKLKNNGYLSDDTLRDTCALLRGYVRLSAVNNLLKTAVFRTGLVRTRYPLGIEPNELLMLMAALQRGEDLPGDIVEVGCGRGKTTVFLNRFLDSLNSRKRYLVVDTFFGFDPEDVAFERQIRQKKEKPGFNAQSFGKFSYNSPAVWHKVVVEKNCLDRVQMLVADIKQVEFEPSQRFSTALIDVDLYLPTLVALPKVYERLVPGGTIVVDDVVEGSLYDGAYRAFHEFVATTTGAEFETLPPKGGVIRKLPVKSL